MFSTCFPYSCKFAGTTQPSSEVTSSGCWVGKNRQVMSCVKIAKPYTVETCTLISGSDQRVLERVKKARASDRGETSEL